MRAAVVIFIILALIFSLVGFWRLQGAGMKGNFIGAMKNGEMLQHLQESGSRY